MWEMYLLATKFGQRPSNCLGYWLDPWTAYQFDNAVLMVGMALENALQETENVGSKEKPRYQPKYMLEQLLNPEFRLDRPKTLKERQKGFIEGLKLLARRGGSIKYKEPKNR